MRFLVTLLVCYAAGLLLVGFDSEEDCAGVASGGRDLEFSVSRESRRHLHLVLVFISHNDGGVRSIACSAVIRLESYLGGHGSRESQCRRLAFPSHGIECQALGTGWHCESDFSSLRGFADFENLAVLLAVDGRHSVIIPFFPRVYFRSNE